MKVATCSLSRKGLAALLAGILAISLMGNTPAVAYADSTADGAGLEAAVAEQPAQTAQASTAQQASKPKKTKTLSFAKRSLSKTLGDKAFTNKVTKPKKGIDTIAYTSSNKKVATVNAKGKVTLKRVGTTTITAKAQTADKSIVYVGRYTLKVNPKGTKIRKVQGAVKGISVNWKAASTKNASGYQIRYATRKSMKGAKTVTVSGAGNTFKVITGLKKGSKYYVQLRTYVKTGGKKYYSSWTSTVSVVAGVNSGDKKLDRIIEKMVADKRIASKKASIDKLRAAFNWVMKYKYKKDDATPTGNWSVTYAKEMYENNKGNCYRYASLFCWLARGLGYDAKAVKGSVVLNTNELVPHGWVEIKLDGRTYLCDCEMGRRLPDDYNLFMIEYGVSPIRYRKA